jgi:hypothetical protein
MCQVTMASARLPHPCTPPNPGSNNNSTSTDHLRLTLTHRRVDDPTCVRGRQKVKLLSVKTCSVAERHLSIPW